MRGSLAASRYGLGRTKRTEEYEMAKLAGESLKTEIEPAIEKFEKMTSQIQEIVKNINNQKQNLDKLFIEWLKDS
jgi:hypothetical protein